MSQTKFITLDSESIPLVTPESVQLFVQSLLKTSETSNEVHELVHFITSRAPEGVSYEHATLLIQEWCALQLNNGPNWPASVTTIMNRISLHLQESDRARSAYSKEGKPNPLAIYWPDPTRADQPRSLFTEDVYARSTPFVDKSTPIGSAGSCFASEIAYRLQEEGYNYVISENYRHPNQPGNYPPACAAYGGIFNSPSFLQLIEKSFRVRELPKLVWRIQYEGALKYCDPFREGFYFNSLEEFEADYEVHREGCRKAFETCKVFCMTLGLNEVWTLKAHNVAIPRYPSSLAPALLSHRLLSVKENIDNLQRMLDIWRVHNPDIKLIITVSPVPLTATFRGEEQHVIAATCHSKATLRVAIEEFVKNNRDVFYFPSYETVMYTVQNAWEPDQRHVARHAVDKVMRLFKRMFVIPEAHDDRTASDRSAQHVQLMQ